MPPRRSRNSRSPRKGRRASTWLLVGLSLFGAGFLWTRMTPKGSPAPRSTPEARPALAVSSATTARIPTPVVPRITFTPPPPVEPKPVFPRPVQTWLEAQIELSRRFFSCGPIDGIGGAQTGAALRAFQESEGLAVTGQLDPMTVDRLQVTAPLHEPYTLTELDFTGLQPVSPTWLGKSEQTVLAHETLLERLAERCHAHPNYLRQINPGIDWDQAGAGTLVQIPAVRRTRPAAPAGHLHIRLGERILQVRDHAGQLTAHFPVSIARNVDKRPVGELRVSVVAPDPNYTFNPDVFPESAEGRELGRKLIIPPGPNNPVGLAWVGLNLPGYGIHGTPHPEQVGRTESHGCFRLANWDAQTLLQLAWVGLPVFVEP